MEKDLDSRWNNRSSDFWMISDLGFEEDSSLRIRRNRPDILHKPRQFIFYDPPSIAKQLAFGVNRKKGTFIDLVYKIKNGWYERQLEKISKCTKELGTMITADPRLGQFLEIDFLTLLVRLLDLKQYSNIQLKLVVPALLKLIESNVLMLLTSGCWGLAFLCDGREDMIIEDKYLGRLITRLISVMTSIERTMILSSLHAMGSIVRWGSDHVIETIIKEDGALLILLILLEEDDMYIVKQTCWILSNITARKEKHIRAVIDGAVIDGLTDGKLIDPLVNVVQNCKLADVRKEAVWAISNAMCGVGIDQIECLRNSCSKINWAAILISFSAEGLLVLVTLEGLVNIEMAKLTWNGQPIDGMELHSILENIIDDSDKFAGYKILQVHDGSWIQRSCEEALIVKFESKQFDEVYICLVDQSIDQSLVD